MLTNFHKMAMGGGMGGLYNKFGREVGGLERLYGTTHKIKKDIWGITIL